jgi:hypothetical protein
MELMAKSSFGYSKLSGVGPIQTIDAVRPENTLLQEWFGPAFLAGHELFPDLDLRLTQTRHVKDHHERI